MWEFAIREKARNHIEAFLVELRDRAAEAGIEVEAKLELDLRIDTSRAGRLFRSDEELIACAFSPDRIGGPNDCE